MESENFALILVLFLAALSTCANAYYFPNGPPHLAKRDREAAQNSSESPFHPEPREIITTLHPEPRDDSILIVNRLPSNLSKKPEAIPTLTMSAKSVVQAFDDKPKAEFKGFNRVQIVPNRKSAAVQKQSSSCSQTYAFSQPGESIIIQSPNYPNVYPNNIQTSTCITSPTGTTMSVVCDQFNVETSQSCVYDYFGLGLDGSPSNVVKYCGKGTFKSSPSSGNSLAIVFKSDSSNPGSTRNDPYRFRCTVTVSDSTTGTAAPPPGNSGNCTCGRRNDGARIVGGTDAKVNEFPWRCYLKTNRISFFCGCTIISDKWVLTAAHCTEAVMPLPAGDSLYVVVGDYDRSSTQETNSQEIRVETTIQHTEYNDDTMDNDVTLLKLSRTLTFSTGISPLCLPYKYVDDDFDGTTVVTSGWGTTSQGGSVSNTLKKVDLPVLTTQQCERYYRGQITENMICTYNPGKDSCQGDSGGSIDLEREGRYYHIGVVSWGIGCARQNYPGVYAKTTKFLSWIENNSGEQFCNI